MIKSAKPIRTRRSKFTQEKILSLLDAYKNQDNLSVVKFCKQNRIHKSLFYYWRKRYANVNSVEPKGFLPVQVTAPAHSTVSEVPALFAEVNGIRLYHFVSADYLKALVS